MPAAFVNGVTLIFVVGWVVFEAVLRMLDPVQVEAVTMGIVAGVGLGVNLAASAILHGGDHYNLDLLAATLHVLGDLLGSAADHDARAFGRRLQPSNYA